MNRGKFSHSDNPLIDEILQKYRDCSTDSITGPKGFTNGAAKRLWHPATDTDAKHQSNVASIENSRAISKTFTVRMPPPKGQDGLNFKETVIEGVPLACFSTGGEKRVCYAELVKKVLKNFDEKEIESTRDRLQIYCPRCSAHQLELFKLAGVLSWSSSSASFISKTDSFRLIGILTSNDVPRRTSRLFPNDSLEVYHECFGGCVGILEIDKYTDPYAKCITCSHCDGIFSPRRFVTHNHASGEAHTCHWGFDDAKWRLYLMLCNEQPTIHVQKLWEMLMNKFSEGKRWKRRPTNDHEINGGSKSGASSPKKMRADDSSELRDGQISDVKENGDNTTEGGAAVNIMCRRSAFRPWSPLNGRAMAVRTADGNSGTSQPLPMPMLSSGSPARLFAPHTIPYLANDNNYKPHACPPRNFQQLTFQGELSKSTAKIDKSPTSLSYTVSEILATPSTKDPRSLEKTAQEMLEVVAQNERWGSFEGTYKKARDAKHPDEVTEEQIHDKLVSFCSNGRLPSPRELSSLLTKEIGGLFPKQQEEKDGHEMRDKLRSELETLRKQHAKKMEEAFEELKSVKRELRMQEANHRQEIESLSEKNIKLQLEVKKHKAEKDDILSKNSKETIDVLQQEVRDLSKKLEEKDLYCRELENEIKSFHAWFNNQRLHSVGSPFIYTLNSNRRDSGSVIRTLHMVNGNPGCGNGRKNASKTNGTLHNESSEDE